MLHGHRLDLLRELIGHANQCLILPGRENLVRVYNGVFHCLHHIVNILQLLRIHAGDIRFCQHPAETVHQLLHVIVVENLQNTVLSQVSIGFLELLQRLCPPPKQFLFPRDDLRFLFQRGRGISLHIA